ncbi:uncharacterized protein LAESUDRAFT_762364 [Laetiporus sulphureus 93-53]|uniref:Uncharacterized protein n=1 Tax=Laetiporus sulphureus 93-53 TaxID=1314785 RepID=A0A165CJN9_9APHY|nr:uncharacterized protein LAESUDRAFT_762364 [Laetiporus sulphureus 93-53]KZT02934.1 hypothetical protein LAESUDRAFT_762364 [Laetiporus sulphureus 93-53]
MEVEHPIWKLLVQLWKSQDDEIGDSTTGVVAFAGVLLEQSEGLLDRGILPIWIVDGLDKACAVAVEHLNFFFDTVKFSLFDTSNIVRTTQQLWAAILENERFAEIAVDAVLSVVEFERKDMPFDLIKVDGGVGGSLADTTLI